MVLRAVGNGARSGYSIRVASRLTGLSSDTLRMWERRYGFPKPERNPAGVRVYSPEHVERLMLVARTLKAGYRAGEVVTRSRDELAELLASTATAGVGAANTPSNVQSLLQRLTRDDLEGMLAELRQAVATLGPKRFLVEVAAPLIERVGEAWATHKLEIRHEHMLSAALSTQLRVLASAYEGVTRSPLVLLCTLPGEQHALGLEMVALYLSLSGATPRIVGADTPPDQILEAVRRTNAQVVGISVSGAADLEAVQADLGWILGELPSSTRLWVGGRRAKSLSLRHPRLEVLVGFEDLDRALAQSTPPS
ncbi:MAG: MerR family transcriptional regulator [Polyangiaceae bacterium]